MSGDEEVGSTYEFLEIVILLDLPFHSSQYLI